VTGGVLDFSGPQAIREIDKSIIVMFSFIGN
jgi:hypothetical protein